MARSFNGTSGAVTVAVDLSSTQIVSIAAWMNWTAFANDDKLMAEYTANSAANTGSFLIDPDESGDAAFVFGSRNAGPAWLDKFTRPSAGVYHHYLFVLNRTTPINVAYVDGSIVSLTTVSHTAGVQGTSFANSSIYLMSRAAGSLFGAGSMADFAVWNGTLTAAEAVSLAGGARPYTIRPSLLFTYLPLDGIQSPEPDLSGKVKNGTLATGTGLASGSPMMMFTPRWPSNVLPTSTPAVTSVFRKTASRIGTRTGTRQTWAA